MSKTLTVRNLDEALVVKLKLRAARHGRSAEAEVRALLADALDNEPREDFWSIAARLQAMTRGRPQVPSEVLQRESRDER